MDIVEVGVDPRTAPLPVRERVALPYDRFVPFLRALAEERWLSEALLVSTCNRTEVYVVSPEPAAAELLLAAITRLVPAAPPAEEDCWAKRLGEEAALHLMRVASGLESQILGETEVLGQVKEAHRLGREAGTVGPMLDRLAQSALHAGKRSRTETPLSRGAISHGQASYEVARQVFGGLKQRSVLVVGAGEMATLAATAIAALPGGTFVVANRTRENAERLAATLPSATVTGLDDVPARLSTAHVAIFAGGHDPVTRAQVETAVHRRRDPLLVLDYGVPRLVDPEVAKVPGVFLYDLEAVEALTAKSLASRREAIPAVEAILGEELATFRGWVRTRKAAPLIRSLTSWAEEVRKGEVAQLPADTPPETRATVEEVTKRLVERLLRRPTARVRQGVEKNDPALPTPDHLRNLFGLSPEEQDAQERADPVVRPRESAPIPPASRGPGPRPETPPR